MPSTLFLPISGNSHLSPGEIQTHRDEELRTCLSLLFIVRTWDGSWQMVRERAHAHPRVSQVPRLPLGVQKCSQERSAGNLFPQPRPHQLLWHLQKCLRSGLQESSPSGRRCCWSPPFREGSGKDNSCSPLLVVHNSRWQLMGKVCPIIHV